MGISLKPSDATPGGGLLDDVDIVITAMRFRAWDYNGTIPTPVLGLEVTFATEDGSGTLDQVYSAGDMKFFVPAEDGKSVVPVGSRTTMVESTNAMAFLTSIVNSGFPEDKIGETVDAFIGLHAHVNALPPPPRPGLKQEKNNPIILITKINQLPWDSSPGVAAPKQAAVAGKKPVTPKKPAAPAVTAPSPAASVSTGVAASAPGGNGAADVEAMTTGLILELLTEKGGTIPKKALANLVFQKVVKDPNRNAIVQTAFSDKFLKEGPWNYDGSMISNG